MKWNFPWEKNGEAVADNVNQFLDSEAIDATEDHQIEEETGHYEESFIDDNPIQSEVDEEGMYLRGLNFPVEDSSEENDPQDNTPLPSQDVIGVMSEEAIPTLQGSHPF